MRTRYNLPILLSLPLWLMCSMCTQLSLAKDRFQADIMWPEVAQSGRYFNFPIGIAIDQHKLFYITDSQSNRVKVLTAQGEFVRSWGSQGTAPGQFDKPLGIVVTANGSILVADTNNNRIQKFNSEGQFIAQWGSLGTGNGQFNHPNHLAIDAQGRIFVSDTQNNRIQVFSATGQWLRSFGSLGAGKGQLSNPLGLFIYNDEVFIAEGPANHRISVFNTDGKFLRSWGEFGSDKNQFDSPENIVVDAQGLVYVSEFGNNRIQVFNRNGQWQRSWGKLGYTGADLWTPFGLAIEPSAKLLYVADSSNNRIQQYTLQGKYLGGWQSQGNNPGEFAAPKMSISNQGEIYVADQKNHRIQVFNQNGQWLRGFGSFGAQPGQFNLPNHVAFAPDNRVFIADTGNHRIQIFDQKGNYLSHWGTAGNAPGQLANPGNLTIAPDGLVYITELGNDRISVFNTDGKFVRTWGKLGSGKVELDNPDGIAVDKSGTVYVADHDNHRVQVFDSQGNYLREWGKDGKLPGEFDHPHGLTLSPKGYVFVADALNNRIQAFLPDGTFIESIGEAGTQPGQLAQPYTVALLDEDTLYTSELANNRIQRFTRKPITARVPYKAIIVAGGGPSTSSYENPIWESTELLSNNAYFALRAQGLSKYNLWFLTAGNPDNDLDGDGVYNDIGYASLSNLQKGITEWAADADNVIIYLNDHGGDGTFKLNPNEILTRKQLKTWLDTLDSKSATKVTVILEACQSASFFPDLGASNRVLISSATRDQPAIISNQGLTAFSYHFWYGIHTGSSLQTAFKRARQGMSHETVLVNGRTQQQNAQLDANGDGLFDAEDFVSLGNYCLGKCSKTAADEPQVTPITTSSNLNGQTSFTLSMEVVSLEPISQAWVIINRPDINYQDPSQPISNLPVVNLSCSDQNAGKYLCQGEYDQFNETGTYSLTFHARDVKNRSSLTAEAITLTQDNSVAPGGNSKENVTYNAQTDVLSVQDVLAYGQHFQVTLQGKDQRYVLASSNLAPVLFTPAATLDLTAERLILPKVWLVDRYYSITLKHLGNHVFSSPELTELGSSNPNTTPTPNTPNQGIDETPDKVS